MGEYADFTRDSEENWDSPYIGCDFDNLHIKKDATKSHPKLCEDVRKTYKIGFNAAYKGTFLYRCLIFYQNKNFLSKKQIERLIVLGEVYDLRN